MQHVITAAASNVLVVVVFVVALRIAVRAMFRAARGETGHKYEK